MDTMVQYKIQYGSIRWIGENLGGFIKSLKEQAYLRHEGAMKCAKVQILVQDSLQHDLGL